MTRELRIQEEVGRRVREALGRRHEGRPVTYRANVVSQCTCHDGDDMLAPSTLDAICDKHNVSAERRAELKANERDRQHRGIRTAVNRAEPALHLNYDDECADMVPPSTRRDR